MTRPGSDRSSTATGSERVFSWRRLAAVSIGGLVAMVPVIGCSSDGADTLDAIVATTTTAAATTTTTATTTTATTTTATTAPTTATATTLASAPRLTVGDTVEVEDRNGTVLDAVVVDVAERPDGSGALASLVVDGVLDLVECTVVIDAETAPGIRLDPADEALGTWIEGCSFPDEPPFDRLFQVDGSPWAFAASESRLFPLADDLVVMSNGCVGPVAEVLAVTDRLIGPSMISGLSCRPADGSEPVDAVVNLTRPSVLLSPGPVDGLLVILERTPDGDLELFDLGTGIEPDPWPLDIDARALVTSGR